MPSDLMTVEEHVHTLEVALSMALKHYTDLRNGRVPHTFCLEAGTQSSEAALGSLSDLRAQVASE